VTRPRLCAFLALVLLASPAFAGSSNSLLDVSPDGTRLAVANTDTGTVSVIDLKQRKKVAEFPCGDHPEGVAWAGNSSTFLATVYGDDCVHFYDAEKGHQFTLPVGDEPYGIVTTKDGKYAYVTHDYPGTVSEIDIPARKVTRTFAVGPGARGIAIPADEKTLFVSEFFTTKLHAVNRETGKVTDTWEAYESDNMARHVALHPKRPKAYLSHIRSRVTAFDARGSIFPQLSVLDLWERPKGEKRRRVIALDTFNNVYVVTNPWEATLSPDGTKLYTIYAGTNDMNVSKVIDDDYQEFERIDRAVTVGKHPRAIRTSPDGAEVYVYNTLDFEVSIHDANMKRLGKVAVCAPAQTEEWRLGKELFQSALPPMGGGRGIAWVACSSCHPDGLTDARVWQNPEGNRKTPNLFGLAHTHPLHWSADRDESQDFEYTIRGKLMQGRGLTSGRIKQGKEFEPVALDQTMGGLSKQLDALAVYTNSFPVRLSPHIPAPGKLSESAERGKTLFASANTKCASCHSGPYYTDGKKDAPFNLHDVGTGGDKREKMGPKYDTPTLLGVYRVNSYLHDGRAKTLNEVLTTHNKDDKHGTTSHLKPAEIDDLVAFLKSLPYEAPPDRTPNTVKDQITLTYPRPRQKK
jgi:YVTN family beta-propeller protein